MKNKEKYKAVGATIYKDGEKLFYVMRPDGKITERKALEELDRFVKSANGLKDAEASKETLKAETMNELLEEIKRLCVFTNRKQESLLCDIHDLVASFQKNYSKTLSE